MSRAITLNAAFFVGEEIIVANLNITVHQPLLSYSTEV
jgi:hypothetical protein